jgi:hypothetical protein
MSEDLRQLRAKGDDLFRLLHEMEAHFHATVHGALAGDPSDATSGDVSFDDRFEAAEQAFRGYLEDHRSELETAWRAYLDSFDGLANRAWGNEQPGEANTPQQATSGRPFNVRAATPRRGAPETLLLYVDRIPRIEEMRWRERDGHYVAELDGFVSNFAHDPDGQGFYGASFELTMEDGSRRTLVGPFSGGAWAVNEAFPELGGVVEATATDSAFTFDGNFGGMAIKLTTARLAEINASFPQAATLRDTGAGPDPAQERRADRLRWAVGSGTTASTESAGPLPDEGRQRGAGR